MGTPQLLLSSVVALPLIPDPEPLEVCLIFVIVHLQTYYIDILRMIILGAF